MGERRGLVIKLLHPASDVQTALRCGFSFKCDYSFRVVPHAEQTHLLCDLLLHRGSLGSAHWEVLSSIRTQCIPVFTSFLVSLLLSPHLHCPKLASPK